MGERPENLSGIPQMTRTDKELMQQTAQGDQRAFEVLYHRHARRFQGFFLRMLEYDAAKAEDFTQELFLRIYEQSARFEENHSFSSWAFSIAYNLCKNEYRHLKVEEKYQTEQRAETPYYETEIPFDKVLFETHLKAAILRLPHSQQAAFTLRYQEELSIGEIAEILQIPKGTVKSRLYQAIRKLSETLKMYHPSK